VTPLSLLLLVAAVGSGCSDAPAPSNPTHFGYDVPLDPASPWPKFRRDGAQSGRSPVRPIDDGSAAWSFATGKGIFSSPVIGGDGTAYIGSADRTFHALSDADGTVLWKRLTGEIIDSSALLDDRGLVYFGSGDGNLYAQAASDGAESWTFTADDPSVTGALINWFEGNVAIGTNGDLYAPNDNFLTYALRRDDASVVWRFQTADQTSSLPALDTASNRLFIGNNFQIAPVPNIFALDAADGATQWSAGTRNGTVAASPALDDAGRMFVGGFDGFLRAFDRASGTLLWAFGARDHIYASPALQPDGTVVQAAADGSIYGLDPATGALRWQYDSLAPFRSSPAIDADGNVYVGSGDGRLVVLNADGRLHWAIRLIDDLRDDLNSSPALGRSATRAARPPRPTSPTGRTWSSPRSSAGSSSHRPRRSTRTSRSPSRCCCARRARRRSP
jgi:outer membrane protein assembly factor BamB